MSYLGAIASNMSRNATRVAATEARGFLDSLQIDDRVQSPGSGPILLGAIPFDSNDPHDFILPHVSLVKSVDGRAWVTTVDDAEPNFVTPQEPAAVAASYTVQPGVSVDHYLEAVKQARDAVRAGSITKAVIARDIVINASAWASKRWLESVFARSAMSMLKVIPSCAAIAVT